MMIIEDLKDFDKKNLTNYRILYSLHPIKSNIIFWILILLNGFFFFLPLLIKKPIGYLFFLPSGFIFYLLIEKRKKESLVVLRNNYNEKFNLNIQNKWSYKTIYRIEYLIFLDFLKEKKVKLNKEQISFIIDSLKYEKSQSNYNYFSIGMIATFLTILLGSFLNSIFNLAKNVYEITSIIPPLSETFILISITIVYIDLFIVKRIIQSRNNKYNRLIRLLENHYLNYDTKTNE